MNNFIDTVDFNSATITRKEYLFLSDFLKERKIKSVLEFGPGISTYCFLDNNCLVDSIECNEKWYNIYDSTFASYKNITVIYNNYQKEGFLNIENIENKTYDIVFVDSPPAQAPFARLNTLLYAFTKSKTVLIHDYRRGAEQNSIKLLQKIYNLDIEEFNKDKGIGILKLKNFIFNT